MSTIYYFNSIDGRACAAIALSKLHRGYALPTNFGYQPNWSKIRYGEDVYLLGILFNMNAMIELRKAYKLIYIDHHTASKKQCEAFGFNCKGMIQDTEVSSCISTWKFFNPEDPIPRGLELISDYTLGKFNLENVEFVEGLNTINTRPDQLQLWLSIFEGNTEIIERVRARGKEILEYSKMVSLKYMNACAFETKFLNFNALAINMRYFSHDFFQPYLDSLEDHGKHIDLLLMYTFRGFDGQYKVTVYSNNKELNVNEILMRVHGAGQKDVGAYTDTELQFEEVPMPKPPAAYKFDQEGYLKSHLIANQTKQSNDRSFLNQCVYYDSIGGFNCAFLNTPEESKNPYVFLRTDLPPVDLGINWAWTNRGQYKVCIYPLSGKLDKDGIIKFIIQLGYEGGATIKDDGVVFYIDVLPFPKIKRDESKLLTSIGKEPNK